MMIGPLQIKKQFKHVQQREIFLYFMKTNQLSQIINDIYKLFYWKSPAMDPGEVY